MPTSSTFNLGAFRRPNVLADTGKYTVATNPLNAGVTLRFDY